MTSAFNMGDLIERNWIDLGGCLTFSRWHRYWPRWLCASADLFEGVYGVWWDVCDDLDLG